MRNHEIHIWYTYIDHVSNKDYKRYEACLCIEERERLSGYILDQKRQQFLISRTLIRSVLSRYDNTKKPSDWKFIYNQYGKPYINNRITNTSNIHFNISHSTNMYVVAISNKQIGIDCETLIKRQLNIDALEYFLTMAEREYIYSIPESQRHTKLIEIWTLKEAFVKAIGIGMNLDFNEICIVTNSIGKNIQCGNNNYIHIKNWKLLVIRKFSDYVVSLATLSSALETPCNIIFKPIVLSI